MALEDLTTGQDLLYYVLGFASQSQSTSDDYAAQAKAAVRKEYWDILEMEPWLFALKSTPGTVVTVASQSVTISSISTNQVTLSATIAASQAGRKIMRDAQQAIYRITAHTAGTDLLTLDAEWVETETSGLATIFQDEYSLASDCMVLWGPLALRGNYQQEIEIIGQPQFKAKYDNGQAGITGPPEVATQIRYDSSGYQRIQLAPWTTDRMVVEYDYSLYHSLDFTGAGAGDTPLLPLPDRWCIAERALWTLWRNKDNDLADSAWKRAEEHLNVMRNRYLPRDSRPQSWMRFRNNLGAR